MRDVVRVLAVGILLLIGRESFAQEDAKKAEARARVGEMNQQVFKLWEAARYAEAKGVAEKAVLLAEKELRTEDPDTATSLNNVATVLYALGDLRGARPIFQRALAIREKGLGPEHPETAQSLNNLGYLLQGMGDLKGARPLLERALAIREKALGPENPDTATSLNNVAALLRAMGDLRGARLLFERALAIREKALGPEHPDTAASLNSLAGLLDAMGDVKGARLLFERTLAIREKALGPEHPDTARSLNDLATLLQAMGDLKRARPLYERALAIREKALGPEHPDTAHSLNDLAALLHAMGDMNGARPLLERALAIQERALGPEHPDTATSLNNLAALLKEMGDLKRARPLLGRAQAIWEKALGPEHPDTAKSLNNLAVVLQDMGDLKGARLLYERAWDSNKSALHWLLPNLSSRERCAMVLDRSTQLAYYLSAFADDPSKTYAAACAWKGAARRASAATLRLPPDAPEEARRLVSDLADSRAQLAKLAFSSPAPRTDEPSVAEQYDAARKRLEAQERTLADLLPDLAARAFGKTEPADVQKVLPEGTALLDVLENCGNLHAWVVRPSGGVKYFALGKASDFEELALQFREALEKNDEKAWKKAGAALREKVEKPLAAALEGTKTLFLSPDGALATVPWGLLPDGDGFLLERLPIVCVGGGAWMVMASRTKPGAGDGLLAFGGIDYDHAEGATGHGTRPDFHANPLPGSEVESAQVSGRFAAHFPKAPCHVVNGSAATVASFERLAPTARYLHVATHGYFDLEHLRGDGRGLTGPMMSEALPAPMQSERQSRLGWNPLLLSGIVMAGANAGDGGNGTDGLLTAEELQGLDLTGVELVVLSACETGRGELAAGEGVLGLSRALAVAGARGFMLSLWSVPDDATQELMGGFYDGLWARGLTPEDALRSTQLAIIARDRAAKTFHPRDWGAWVLTR